MIKIFLQNLSASKFKEWTLQTTENGELSTCWLIWISLSLSLSLSLIQQWSSLAVTMVTSFVCTWSICNSAFYNFVDTRDLMILPLSIYLSRRARRLLAIMCIGFLANHHLCKHPQNQLVRVYQCLFNPFQILFFAPTLRCLIFSKQFWIIDKWSYSTVKQTNEAQYTYGYICLLLEMHMAMRVRTISWKYKASFNMILNDV